MSTLRGKRLKVCLHSSTSTPKNRGRQASLEAVLSHNRCISLRWIPETAFPCRS